MPDETPNGPTVSYSVKDLVQRLDAKVDTIISRLDSKVDYSQFQEAMHRISALESLDSPLLKARVERTEDNFTSLDARLRLLETGDERRLGGLSTAQKIWTTILSVAVVITPVVTAFIISAHRGS